MNTSFEGNTTTGKDEWLTPPHIIEALGPFDLDPCSPINPPWRTAITMLNRNDDGLSVPWAGYTWCNPPYGREGDGFIKKMVEHNNGILLIFGRTDTKIWHNLIFPNASGFLFIKGRLKFYNVDGTPAKNGAGAASVLVSFGEQGREDLRKQHGKLGFYMERDK
jgi:hypothetical protein